MSEVSTRCAVCGALLDEEDLFCCNCGTESPRRNELAPLDSMVSTHNVTCERCGASMSYDASAQNLRCPFCGSERLTNQQDAKVVKPNRVVPFAVGRDQAVGILREWLSRGFWRPGDLAKLAAVVEMAPVYIPYWVFAARTHSYWTADSSQTPAGARASWFPLFGEHRGDFAGLLVGASGKLTPAETWDLLPFALEQGVPTEKVDLDNAIVEAFGLDRKYARSMARGSLEGEVRRESRQQIPGNERNHHVNVKIEGLQSEPVLLPVWISAYRYKEDIYRFLVNGQTGKATGSAPTSIPKILVAIVIAVVVLAAIAGLIALIAQAA